MRLWLQDFPGERVIVPVEDDGWLWVGNSPRGRREQAQQVTQAIRQIAEGQPVRLSAPVTGWMLAAYILGGVFALLLLTVIVASAGIFSIPVELPIFRLSLYTLIKSDLLRAAINESICLTTTSGTRTKCRLACGLAAQHAARAGKHPGGNG